MSQKQEIFTLLGGKVKMYRSFYNPTSDAVWLAAFAASTKKVKNVLEVGIGTGGASLCLSSYIPNISITGLDISEQMLAECKKNIELNKANISLKKEDILKWRTPNTFDLVITNPPYFKGTPAKHNAHHNVDLTLWVKKCIAKVKPSGTFCIITSADTMSEVLKAIPDTCGCIKTFPLFGSKITAERVLISTKLGSKEPSVMYKGLPMNYEPVLRDGLTIEEALATLIKQW